MIISWEAGGFYTMSIGIYKYQNKINGHIYIGQSTKRWAKCGATTLTRHLTTDKIAGKVPDTKEPAHWIELS